MRVTLFIDTKGIVHSDSSATGKGRLPVRIEKQNKKIHILIRKGVTVTALLSLIKHMRLLRDISIDLTSEVDSLSSAAYQIPASRYLHIGQLCMDLFEKSHDGQFFSHITYWEEQPEDQDQLPPEMTALSMLKVSHLDTPTALSGLSQKHTANAAFFRFNREQELMLVKRPENMVWPPADEDEELADVIAIAERDYYEWLLIAGQIALAVGTGLRQFGHIQIDSEGARTVHPFVKLLFPIASLVEKPKNYRLITVTYLIHQKAFIL